MSELTSTPPQPWTKRMLNAGEVLQAYMSVELRLSTDLRAAQKMNLVKAEQGLMNKIKAAKLQTESARAQMWIIHKEEQGN